MTDWPSGARAFVVGRDVARLATAGADGAPHAVPICFALLDDRLYSVVDAKPKRNPTNLARLRNVRANPRAAVLIDHYDEDWTRLEYVLLRGAAAVVDDRDEFARALTALRAKYPAYRAMDLSFESHPMLRVDVERVVHWRYRTEVGP